MTDPARTIPILPSLNIAEARDFYHDHLGFTPKLYEAENYLIMTRDKMEFHFSHTDDRSVCEQSVTYVRGGQVEDLYGEYRDRKIPGLSRFLVRPWNMLEFHIIDPHGVLLRFGMAPDEARDQWPKGHPG